MKTKIKRHSRAVLSIVLTLCMLVSCMTVGIIATDAAKVADSDKAIGAKADDEVLGDGDTTYYLHYGTDASKDPEHTTKVTMTSAGNNTYTASFTAGSSNYFFGINTSTTAGSDFTSSTSYTSTTTNWGNIENGHNNYWATSWATNGSTVYVTFNSSTGAVTSSSTDSGGGGEAGSSSWYLRNGDYGWNSNGAGSGFTYNPSTGYYEKAVTWNTGDNWFRVAKDNTQYNGAGKDKNTELSLDTWHTGLQSATNGAFNYKPAAANTSLIIQIDEKAEMSNTKVRVKTATSPVASSLAISADPTEHSTPNATSTITVKATNIASGVTNLTYTIYDRANNDPVGSPVTVTNGATSATFTVTPNARVKSYYASVKPTTSEQQALYDEVWTSTDATITNSADAYIPRYTVNFSSNNDSYGTVTAKDASGNAITSGASIKEGESVTFTATAKAGYEFYEWSTFDTKATSVTRVIRAATTVQGKFGPKGYSIFYQSDATAAMTEKSNGWYISPALPDGYTFTIKQNFSGKYLNAGGNSDYYKWNSGWMGPDHWDGISDSDWESTKFTTPKSKFYKNETGKTVYCVYDPSTNRVWVTEDPDGLYEVHVVAKDGTIRYGYRTTADYTQVFGDTTVELVSPTTITGTVDNNAYDGMAVAYNLTANDVRNGVTLKIKTQTKSEYVSQGYYVKGFVVSGYEESFSVLWQEFVSSKRGAAELSSYDDRNWIHKGYNEFELTINGYPEKGIEITPVYAKREVKSGDNIRFYVEGFAGEVYKEWGGTLAVDAFNVSGARVFGEYPGQPMLNYNGRYVVDLPRTGVSGITLNNYVWDRIHSNLFYGTTGTGKGHEATVKAVNYQTYDFNDFVYLKNKLDATHNEDEDIVFSFRHRTNDSYNTKETSQLGKSTYYKDSPNASQTKDYDYRKGFNTIDPSDSIYQWENLTDFYGNRVDIFSDYVDTKDSSGAPSNPKANYNPIRIVSNGYDYSEAGKYATAWAVYKPVDASRNLKYTGDFDHYELFEVYGGQGITTDPKHGSSSYLVDPRWTENLRWKYDQAYRTAHASEITSSTPSFVFDLAQVPTVISYEYQVQDGYSNLKLEGGNGEPAYRSDGRWFTTSSDQLLTAHTIIEYAERDEESLYHRDYYQGGGIDYTSSSGYDPTKNTGLATGIKAYFENDDTVPYMGQNHQNTSGNTQAYAMSDGDHEFLLKAEDDPNGEYVFKGWYMYTNGKYSLVSRSQTYPSEATANDVYVARFYKAPAGTLNITHNLDSSSNGNADCFTKVEVLNSSDAVIDSTSFPRTTNSIKVLTNYIKCTSTNKLRITIDTVPDEYGVLNGFNENISGTLRELTQANVRLAIPNATVTPNISDKTATITFDIKELFSSTDPAEAVQNIKSIPLYSIVNEYTYKIDYTYPSRLYGSQTYTAEGKILASEYSNSTYRNSSTDRLTGTFVQLKQVYEDNFMKDMTWNYNNITTDKTEYKYTAAITANQPETAPTKNLQFNFPYEYQSTTIGGKTIYTAKEACPTYDTNQQDPSPIAVPYMVVYYGEQKVDNETKYYFTQAPASVKVGSTIYPFQYWSLEVDGSEVARCYSRNFNFAMFNNYTVTPIFSNTGSGAIGSDTAATITFLEYSRNQWNYNQKGTRSTDKTAMDTVYADFDLSFTNKGELIDASSATEVGVIIENLGTLDKDGSGVYVTDMSHYGDRQQYKNDLKTFINAGGTDAAKTTYLAATGNTSQNVTKRAINKSILTNKNRTEYYLGINASEDGKDTNNRTSLYRIYSYIKNGSTVTLSDPVYINIYAEASK